MRKLLVFITILLFINIAQPAIVFGSTKSNLTKSKTFSDIQGHWAQREIEALISKGAIGGYADGTFRPQATVTRAQFLKMLAGVMGVTSDTPLYRNIKKHWAEKYMHALLEEGVMKEYQFDNPYGGYSPDYEIIRYEMNTYMARALATNNYIYGQLELAYDWLEKDKLKAIIPFKDVKDTYVFYQKEIALTRMAGIAKGQTTGYFNGEEKVTRAQAAVMLKRYLDVKNQTPDLNKVLKEFKSDSNIQAYLKRRYEVNTIIDSAIKNRILSNDTDIEKLIKVTQFISENALIEMSGVSRLGEIHTAYGTLVEGRATAEGYAETTRIFLDKLGFENEILELESGPRYASTTDWNLVKLKNGKWYHINNALNDQFLVGSFTLNKFLLTDAEMKKAGYSWDEKSFPKSTKETVLTDLHQDRIANIYFSGKTLYLLVDDPTTSKRHIVKRTLANPAETTIMECPSGRCTSFAADDKDEWLYVFYSNDNITGIYKMRTNGSDHTLFKQIDSLVNMKIEKQTLIYEVYDPEKGKNIKNYLKLN